MADRNPIARFFALPNDSFAKTIGMAFIVALVCAVIVSAAAVSLRPIQQANKDAAQRARMQEMLAALPGMEELLLESGADELQAVLVDLSSGTIAEDMDAASYDQRAAANDTEQAIEIASDADIAGLSARAPYAPAFLLYSGDDLALAVLPVRGSGYASMLYAYLALEGDLETIAGLTFYEQGDTPGLGARVQDPAWEALWPGTKLVDADGNLAVEVVKGGASEVWQVDGITGATNTSNGVTNLLRYWLGPDAFGPFLEKLKAGEIGQ